MAAAIRLGAFLLSAMGLELVRGAGAATLVLAALLGFARYNPLLLIAATGGGAAMSLALPESGDAAGKIAHSLSNAPFVVGLHALLAATGYLAGRCLRRMR